MQYFPTALQELADQFARLPGIGGKTAQRLAFHVLELDDADAKTFADAVAKKAPTQSNVRGSAAYRTHLIRVLTQRALLELGGN